MATKEAVFSLRVETGNSVQDVQNFDKAVSNLNKDIKQVQQTAQQGTGIDTFDAKLQELNARVEAGGLTMRELTQTMKAYQTIAAQAGMESPVGQQAIQAAGQLKDQIGDLKAATTALSSDFVGLDTALAGIETGAAVFQGFQSAIALTGVENEKLVQTMVKLQAVQGVVNAVNTVAKNLNSDTILGIQLRTYWEKLYTFAVGESTGALKLFRIALLSTGIGAVVIGVTALISNFDSLIKIIKGTTFESEALADSMSAYRDAAKSAIEETSQVGNAFELARKGVISKKEALHLYNETLGDSFGIQTDFNKAEKVFRDKTEAYIQATALRAQANALLSKAAEEQAKALSASLEDQTSFLDKATASLYDLFGETLSGSKELFRAQVAEENQIKKIANERSNKFNELAKSLLKEAELVENKNGIISANEKATIDQIKEKAKEAYEKKKELWEAEKKKSQEFIDKMTDLLRKRESTEIGIVRQGSITRQELAEREAAFIERLKSQEFRDAQGYLQAQITQDETNWKVRQQLLDLQKAEELRNTELTEGEKLAIEAKYAAESAKLLEARIQRIADVGQYIKDEVADIFQVMSDFENIRLQELENNTQNELAMLDQKYQQDLNSSTLTAEQKAALDKNYAAAKYATELKLFNETEKIKEKQFKRDKALRIAQAGIDTAAAIVKAIQMFGPPPSPAGIAGIAAAVGIGLAQIAAIASTKYQAGTAPSISGGGTGISAGATGSELGGAAVNGSLAGQQMSTAELVSQTNQGNVYVLESDITGTQNKVSTQNKLSVW